MSIPKITHRVVAKTTNYRIEGRRDRSGTVFTNRGATANVALTLPPAARSIGYEYTFLVHAGFTIVVTAPVADTLVALADVAADSVTFASIGTVGQVFCDGVQWFASNASVGATSSIQT